MRVLSASAVRRVTVGCRSLSSSALRQSETKTDGTPFSRTKAAQDFHFPMGAFIPPTATQKIDLGDYYDSDHFHRARGLSINASIVVFLVYFCILREENDVDARLGQPLYQKVPLYEKEILREKLWRSELAKDTNAVDEISKRLEQIDIELEEESNR